jgi:hypothetical protein
MDSLIIHSDQSDPYHTLIEQFLVSQFPTQVKLSKSGVVDAVTNELFGTNQNRYGPKPSAEYQVAMREVVKYYTDRFLRIPILVPWGSRKPHVTGSVDVAELSALKQLDCLRQRIEHIYPLGIDMRIRVEDASGNYLFEDEGVPSRLAVEHYTEDFTRLVKVLGLDWYMKAVPESTLFNENTMKYKADEMLPDFIAYLAVTDGNVEMGVEDVPSFQNLKERGWKGEIPMAQREYYFSRYGSLYPNLNRKDAITKLARYFASSLARVQMKGRGDDIQWEGKYLQVTFVPPVPGAPDSIFNKTLYYRTVPLHFGASHMPPWRAKGYLRVHNDNTVEPKISSWVNAPLWDSLIHFEAEMQNLATTVKLRMDYQLADLKEMPWASKLT